MVVDNLFIVLRSMDQTMGTDFIDQSGCASRVTEDFAYGRIGKDFLAGTGVIKVSANVISCLSPIVMVKSKANVETLTNCRVDLAFEQFPQFALTDQDKGHGAFGVKFEIEQEADFFKHFMVEEMSLVNDDHRFEMMKAAQEFNFAMQLAFGIASVEFGLNPELFQKSLIEMARSQFGIRYIEDLEAVLIEQIF